MSLARLRPAAKGRTAYLQKRIRLTRGRCATGRSFLTACWCGTAVLAGVAGRVGTDSDGAVNESGERPAGAVPLVVTYIVDVTLFAAPPLSVTLTVIVYVPLAAYEWVAVQVPAPDVSATVPVELPPSPHVTLHVCVSRTPGSANESLPRSPKRWSLPSVGTWLPAAAGTGRSSRTAPGSQRGDRSDVSLPLSPCVVPAPQRYVDDPHAATVGCNKPFGLSDAARWTSAV